MTDWLAHLSYFGIVFVLILTGVGLPIPEEVPIIAAGVASANGQLLTWLALGCCLFGALAGDCLMYAMGYHFGYRILRDKRWFARVLDTSREQQIERMIARHGWKVFLVSRFLVGLRSPVYVTAGILRVPFRRFLLIDAFCATLVVTTFFGLSYYYASHIETLWTWIRESQYALTVLVAMAAIGVIVWYHVRHRHSLSHRKPGVDETASALHHGEEVGNRKSAV